MLIPALVLATLTTSVICRPAENVDSFGDVLTPTISRLARSASSNSTSVCSGNSASDRSAWCNYDTVMNYYNDGPETGVIVEYWFDLVNTTLAPDGVSRDVLTVNGTIPGPTIQANWGDTVVVHLANGLANNGTGLHFHGVRQNWTNSQDGVPSIVQCPVAPGDSITYTWKATQYGSSWYHSHFALQAWEGVFGGILINGPATAEYDKDLGVLFLNDWDHSTADALYASAETDGVPTLGNGLINGTNTDPDDASLGSRFEMSLTESTSYRIRLVNGAIDTHFDFSIDNHTLQVIASDFVPIEPYITEVISIGMGQRYDIIVTADQADVASDFWLRAVPDSYCSDNDNADDIRGIVHYGDSTSTPTTSAWDYDENDCAGEALESIVPYLAIDAESPAAVTEDLDITVRTNDENWFKWYVGETSFLMEWGNPTALQILNNDTSFSNTSGVIELTTADEWIDIVADGKQGTYESASPTLNTSNPPRGDVAMLPASGYLVIAFKADNPGAWLCHCHIGWHTEEGFDLQFVERYSEVAALYNKSSTRQTCSNWNEYQQSVGLEQDDSGV